jgi:hypothetical protein
MKQRNRHVVIKCNDEELAKLHAIAEANDEPIARFVRRWIDLNYRAQFGDKAPPKAMTRRAAS